MATTPALIEAVEMTADELAKKPWVNEICRDCEVKKACREVLQGWRQHRRHRPDFVVDVVKFGAKNGASMRCLSGGR